MLYQPNRCALLESALCPGHTLVVDRHGKVADESSAGYAELSKEFLVFVKVNSMKIIRVYRSSPSFLLPYCKVWS